MTNTKENFIERLESGSNIRETIFEIIAYIDNDGSAPSECMYYLLGSFEEEISYDNVAIFMMHDVSIGGSNGEGDYVYRVLKIEIDNQEFYFEITGWHSSMEPVKWNKKFTRVYPKQKTIIVYE